MYGKMQETRLIESMPLMCTLAISSQDPILPHPESPQGSPSADCSDLTAATSFVYWYGRQHFSFTATRSPRSRCGQSLLLLRAVRENLSHAFLLTPSALLTIFGVSWLVDASPSSLLSSSRGIVSICVSLYPNLSFPWGQWSVWIRAQPSDLILTWLPL